MTISIYSFFLLNIALSTDIFLAGLSYSIGHVRIPPLSAFLISLISGAMLTISLLAGNILSAFFPETAVKILSFLVLLFLAFYKLYDTLSFSPAQTRDFTTGSISEKVNQHDVQLLSAKEACLLSFFLSVDNISAGLGIGTPALHPVSILFLAVVIHYLVFLLGILSGKLLPVKNSNYLSRLSAGLLFLLAILRLF